jgi:mannose-6-phosphate isomerase
MFLRSGTPHAYVYGTALEIMANSDNVLRAGLTAKHIDIQELVTNMAFTPLKYDELRLKPKKANNITHYPVPVVDFSFSIYTQQQAHPLTVNSAEILFAIDAPVSISHDSGETLTFNKGESIFIPAYVKEYKITTLGRLARAYTA